MATQMYDQLILGDSLQTILSAGDQLMPVISEYQFQREVLDILTNPFGPEALNRYAMYVGELTKPLRVVADTDRDQVLFEVPALVQTPRPTMARDTGLTADTFMSSLSRDQELGGQQIPEKVRTFMSQITQIPDYVQTVIYPVREILQRYGRQMVAIPGVDGAGNTATSQAPAHSSFSDEYED